MDIGSIDWLPIALSLQLAAVTCGLLLVVGLPLSYWLALGQSRWRRIVEVIVALPLVLPPTVLGFYLLLALSPQRGLGAWLQDIFDLRLVFSFEGLVLGSMIYSLPFMVQPLQAGLRALPSGLRDASRLLGKSDWTTFWRVLLPNIRPALWTGIGLSFAHTIGEFGVVLMIGGSLSGETRVASIAIYEAVERLDYASAHTYALVLLGISFVLLLLVYGRQGTHKTYPSL
ncbi:MAG: molybdate ABC transporter permease subunit [Bacteroidota bacterium]